MKKTIRKIEIRLQNYVLKEVDAVFDGTIDKAYAQQQRLLSFIADLLKRASNGEKLP